MNTRMQKHRMMRWISCLFIVFTLVASSGAEAASTCRKWINTYCSDPNYQNCLFPTELAAVQAYYAGMNAAQAEDGLPLLIVTSCDENTLQCPYTFGYFSGNTGAPWITLDCPSLAITLSGGDQIEPSKGTTINNLPITATVVNKSTNQPPSTPVKVRISFKVEANSGGHDHGDSTRPRGSIENTECASDAECWSGMTDGNGNVVFNFKSPEAAGTHTITATCDGCSNNPQTKDVKVKVVGLEKIPEIPFLYTLKLPNRDTNHPATHFLTQASAEKLKKIALYYYVYTFKKKKPVNPDFVVNDASLEWGGVLDCFLTCDSAEYPSTEWHKHHIEHRRGSVIDVKANGDPGSIVYGDVFKRSARKFSVDVGNLHGSGSGLHYHLRLNNAKE